MLQELQQTLVPPPITCQPPPNYLLPSDIDRDHSTAGHSKTKHGGRGAAEIQSADPPQAPKCHSGGQPPDYLLRSGPDFLVSIQDRYGGVLSELSREHEIPGALDLPLCNCHVIRPHLLHLRHGRSGRCCQIFSITRNVAISRLQGGPSGKEVGSNPHRRVTKLLHIHKFNHDQE